jgi:O-antigen/teichoic acid export membrane protein
MPPPADRGMASRQEPGRPATGRGHGAGLAREEPWYWREPVPRARAREARSVAPAKDTRQEMFWTRSDQDAAEKAWQDRQLAGLAVLVALAQSTTTTGAFPAVSTAPSIESHTAAGRPRILSLLKDPAIGGAAVLISSSVVSGVLAFVFWTMAAHQQHAGGLGSASAEISAIMFLANIGSLNLINVFARFLPEAGGAARRLIATSYSATLGVGLLATAIFFVTPLAGPLVASNAASRLGFALCVVLCSIFMVQDGGLVGFGRYGWVLVENILVATVRLALLPLTALFIALHTGLLLSWALPMAGAVLVINAFIFGQLAGREKNQQPRLPTARELGGFVAIDSVTTAVSAAVTAFLPALVTLRLGADEGGYFYVPWMIATMVPQPLSAILISMVREVAARPEKAAATIRRSMVIVLSVVVVAVGGCLLLPSLVLGVLGSNFAVHGDPLLRWIGLSVPAMAINLLFWSTCLVRKRPWPVFAVNLTTSTAIVGGVLTLSVGSSISSVGAIYCMVQWAVALVLIFPTIRAIRILRGPTAIN